MRSTNSVDTFAVFPMTTKQAGDLVDRLLGSYPSLNLHDPETYITAVTALFRGYPFWAGESVVRKVTSESKFVPTLAEIRPHLESEVRTHRYAQEWERSARQTLLEGQKQLSGPKEPRPTLDEMRAKHGPNWGIKDPDKKPMPTREECRQQLIAQIGQAAFDAIPDAPTDTIGDWKKISTAMVNFTDEPKGEAAE
jgi:hypothetical protein